MPVWLQAGMWGFGSGAVLIVGAAIAWFTRVPRPVIAAIMAFGAGVLISALAFEMIQEAEETGGLLSAAIGFLGGALLYTVAAVAVARRGAHTRKRPVGQTSEDDQAGSGTAIAIGSLLDGVPESIVLGLGLVEDGAVNPVVLVAIAISNVPEGLSSAAGMKQAGRSARFVFGVWIGIALASGVAAVFGYTALQNASPMVVGAISATAAGAILAMISDTMLPEAFERTRWWTGMFTVLGFLTAFSVDRLYG